MLCRVDAQFTRAQVRHHLRAQHHGASHVFAQRGVRNRKRGGLQHCGVRGENLVYFARHNLFSAAVDHLLQASGYEQVSVLIQSA